MTDPWTFSFRSETRLHFGDGLLDRCGELIPFPGPFLVVTGRTSAVREGYVARLARAVAPRRCVVFAGVSPNPRLAEVLEAAALGRWEGVGAVIGLGGGSALDAAKAVAAALAGVDVAGVLARDETVGVGTVPVIAVPTTAGTGSETSEAAILSDDGMGLKHGLRGPGLAPRMALIDPELSATLPRETAAETGFDVLTHAVETWVSRRSSALVELHARHALAVVLRELPARLADSGDPGPRRALALASALMGWNLASSSTCLPHRLQYPVGALTDSSHPAGLAALYPAWLRRAARLEPEPFRFLGQCLGVNGAEAGAEALIGWMKRHGLARGLRGLGVQESDVPGLVAGVRGNLAVDPCDHSREALSSLYLESMEEPE